MQKHLNDLSRKLTAHHWQIAEHEGNELDISAVWPLRHPAAPTPIRLAFEGMGDLAVLPPAQSYGCHVEHAPHISLYFAKNNPAQWQRDLSAFVNTLEQMVFQAAS